MDTSNIADQPLTESQEILVKALKARGEKFSPEMREAILKVENNFQAFILSRRGVEDFNKILTMTDIQSDLLYDLLEEQLNIIDTPSLLDTCLKVKNKMQAHVLWKLKMQWSEEVLRLNSLQVNVLGFLLDQQRLVNEKVITRMNEIDTHYQARAVMILIGRGELGDKGFDHALKLTQPQVEALYILAGSYKYLSIGEGLLNKVLQIKEQQQVSGWVIEQSKKMNQKMAVIEVDEEGVVTTSMDPEVVADSLLNGGIITNDTKSQSFAGEVNNITDSSHF